MLVIWSYRSPMNIKGHRGRAYQSVLTWALWKHNQLCRNCQSLSQCFWQSKSSRSYSHVQYLSIIKRIKIKCKKKLSTEHVLFTRLVNENPNIFRWRFGSKIAGTSGRGRSQPTTRLRTYDHFPEFHFSFKVRQTCTQLLQLPQHQVQKYDYLTNDFKKFLFLS